MNDSLEQIDFQHESEHLFYARIPWDSEYLHNTTVQVLSTQPELPSQATLAKFCAQFSPGDLLFVKCAPQQQDYIQRFERAGFYVVEESVEPHLDLTDWSWPEILNDQYHLRAIRDAEVEQVSQLSAQSFTGVSRYFLDPAIPKAGAQRHYAEWVKTSMSQGEDVQVLVNTRDQVVGFFINQYAGPVADNRLIAVDPAWRGQGLGKELYVHMLVRAQSQGATRLISHVAKGNQIAVKLYTDLGATFHHPQIVLHKVISSMPTISVVIPVYNSEHTIRRVVEGIVQTCHSTTNLLHEIILINDASPDQTARVCRELAQTNPKVKFLQLAKNVGQHNAILTGMRETTGDILVCMDDDLQHDPQDILKLVGSLTEHHLDVVYASFEQKEHGIFRNFGSRVNDWMLNVLLKKPKNLVVSSFFAVRRSIVDVMIQFHGPTVYLPGLTLRATSAIGNIPVTHHARLEGKSNYSFKKLLQLWLNGVMNFSILPLRMCTVSGIVLAGLGFVFGVVILISKLLHPGIPVGYTSLLLLVVILGGINLIFVGVVGEYVGRLYMALSQQPQSVITERIHI